MNGNTPSLNGSLSSCCLGWRVDEQTDGRLQASADFVFAADYAGFAGHFPDKPILPGIVQLAAVRYLAECAVGRKLVPHSYGKIKFKGMIGPGDPVAVTVVLSPVPTGWSGTFRLTRFDGVAASGAIEFISEGI